MFRMVTIKDEVRVLPTKFNMDMKEALKESLQETIEGKIHPEIGIFLLVDEIMDIGEGRILPEDGAIHYPAEFKVMAFKPELNELIIGEVVDITEFGAFTRIGPMDALIHVSQVMDDKISYDAKNSIFTGKKTGYKLKEGDIVHSRIVGVSLGKGRSKIAMTMRQPFLGCTDWIEKERKKKQKKAK